jgi:hypothetical protein
MFVRRCNWHPATASGSASPPSVFAILLEPRMSTGDSSSVDILIWNFDNVFVVFFSSFGVSRRQRCRRGLERGPGRRTSNRQPPRHHDEFMPKDRDLRLCRKRLHLGFSLLSTLVLGVAAGRPQPPITSANEDWGYVAPNDPLSLNSKNSFFRIQLIITKVRFNRTRRRRHRGVVQR